MKTMVVLFGLILVPCLSVAQAELRVGCIQGCESSGENQSVNLLLRKTESVPVVIRWTTNENPQTEGRIVTLYAGNPAMQEAIADRGKLTFTATKNGEWEATRQFAASELGRGTFLAVVTQRTKESEQDASGEDEEILDWHAFRLLTTAEQGRKEQGVPPGDSWSVSVSPGLLQASSGHGVLPPARGGDKQAWWSLAEMEGNTSNLDLDGEESGIPGLTIQVSTPWHSSATEGLKDMLREKVAGVTGHQVRFGDLEWREQPDRTVTLGADKRLCDIDIRYYYTVVTLFTNATVKSFDEKEVGANSWFTSPTYFSHETSARLAHTDDPRFWASYSKREYSADPRMLRILQHHVKRFRTVPGLSTIQQDDGDGGGATYTAGFSATVRPWERPAGRETTRGGAGFISLDVVAVRKGIGRLVTEGSAGTSSAWCQVIGCGDSGHGLDLDKPPSGYQVTQPQASLATLPGNLPMIQEAAVLSDRGILSAAHKGAKGTLALSERALPPAACGGAQETPDETPRFPKRVRFGVSANLRSGALLQNESWPSNHIKNIVPINTYAQFVVKMTVAMGPNAAMFTNDEMHMPVSGDMGTSSAAPKPADWWAWLTEHMWVVALAGGGLLVTSILVFVPGGITLVRSIMGVLTQALQLLVDVFALLFKKLAALVHRKPGE